MLFEVDKKQLTEAVKNGGRLIVQGVLQRANSKNQNGRVYPMNILHRESKNYHTNFIAQKRALGELDHPDSSVVNLKNVSHNITEMHFEGDNLVGTVEVLDTPAGNILRNLFEAGIKLGISSRGLGSVQQSEAAGGSQEVQDDFELIAFDFVSNPSTHGAFLHPVQEGLNENIDASKRTCGKWCKVESLVNDIIRS